MAWHPSPIQFYPLGPVSKQCPLHARLWILWSPPGLVQQLVMDTVIATMETPLLASTGTIARLETLDPI
jgi:hypothetical protein